MKTAGDLVAVTFPRRLEALGDVTSVNILSMQVLNKAAFHVHINASLSDSQLNIFATHTRLHK